MMKKFFIALLVTIGLASPGFCAGTIPLSLTQRLDNATFRPLSGGKLYFIQAGTTSTPQNAYQDSALTIPWPNPLTLDAGGNIPQLFFADGSIKIRLTNSVGANQLTADGILVVGPSGGGGGGSTVDPTTIIATGDIKARYGTGNLSGFVRANGRTIGSASSGASERANADCQPLFEYLWTTDANLTVSTGRGASANADWVANKTITLPDWRGRALAALDDMGNTAAGRLTATYFGTAATVLGAAGGAESQTLTLAQLPSGITSTVTGTQQFKLPAADPISMAIVLTGSGNEYVPYWHVAQTLSNNTITGTATSNNTSGAAHPIASPMMLATFYLKL